MSTSAAVESGRSAADLGILDRIIAETKLTPDDEAYDIAKRGVSAFIEELLKPQNENKPVKKLLVDRTNFRENIKLEIINASKQDLLDDFEDSQEITQSGLYKHIYTAEYGQFGGQPVGALIANYFFDPSAPDVKTLQYVA